MPQLEMMYSYYGSYTFYLVSCLLCAGWLADDSVRISKYVISLSAGIIVGYNVTAVNVSEIDGVAQMTVAISMPPGADPIQTSFSLIANTLNGTATGLA